MIKWAVVPATGKDAYLWFKEKAEEHEMGIVEFCHSIGLNPNIPFKMKRAKSNKRDISLWVSIEKREQSIRTKKQK